MGRRKPGRPGITDEQAERVRDVLRWVKKERYADNASALSLGLGMTSSAVSQMLSRKNRPSYDTVLLLARLLDCEPAEVLTAAVIVATAKEPDRYPERAAALGRLRGMLPEPVEDRVRSMIVHGAPYSEADWIRYAMRCLSEHEHDEALFARVTPDLRHGRTQ
jgi:transcriptional regulator with XRE-family HTH domain